MLETIPEEDEFDLIPEYVSVEWGEPIIVDNGIVLSNLSYDVLSLRIKSILIELEFKNLKRIYEFSRNTF
jgi:hypothetical protein